MATVMDLIGVEFTGFDSISLLPVLRDPDARVREIATTERFLPNGGPPDPLLRWDRAARNGRYKLIVRGVDEEEFYDLDTDPFEFSPLLDLNAEQATALELLRGYLGSI